jgi:hypothetical protein
MLESAVNVAVVEALIQPFTGSVALTVNTPLPLAVGELLVLLLNDPPAGDVQL